MLADERAPGQIRSDRRRTSRGSQFARPVTSFNALLEPSPVFETVTRCRDSRTSRGSKVFSISRRCRMTAPRYASPCDDRAQARRPDRPSTASTAGRAGTSCARASRSWSNGCCPQIAVPAEGEITARALVRRRPPAAFRDRLRLGRASRRPRRPAARPRLHRLPSRSSTASRPRSAMSATSISPMSACGAATRSTCFGACPTAR